MATTLTIEQLVAVFANRVTMWSRQKAVPKNGLAKTGRHADATVNGVT
jgi:hypothetical protein